MSHVSAFLHAIIRPDLDIVNFMADGNTVAD
jgi:hypothetical protein